MADPFGEAYRGYLSGNHEPMVIEREDGYVDTDNLESYFASYSDFPACQKKALEKAKGRVLDIGMGVGRVALHLQKKGFDVVGVDISDLAISIARERGVKFALKMSACDLDFPDNRFDTVMALGNNFGLCGSPDMVAAMLVRLRRIISDDGIIIAESLDPLNTTLPEHLSYHEENRSRGNPPGQTRIRFRYGKSVGAWYDLLLTTPAEMKAISARAGWTVSEMFYYPESGPMYTVVLSKS
ncbi:MAG: class I SAM-dependent methyltransferase [Candidatus Thermoplasmatota archaeon]|nr:class I SAM-dependent methyltransferase [Candidatus Thermoplasmatota archaeon]